jgi:hypothetical protein
VGTEWIGPGLLLVRPDADEREIAGLLADAERVQFDAPLPARLVAVLADALRSRPQVELYVYGHYGEELGRELEFLRGFEHVEHLSLNLNGLTGVDGLARFTALRSLTLQGMRKRHVSVAPAAHATGLERLAVDQPVRDLDVIHGLAELHTPATAHALESLDGHPALRRLVLHFGTHRDLTALESCPELTDISLWQIRQLTASDLAPVARIPKLNALELGALRNVETLSWLTDSRLRFLTLERLPSLDSFEPLSTCRRLKAFGAWDSRPADRSLAALHDLPLADLVLGDVYPSSEIESLLEHSGARIRIRGDAPRGEPELRWRGVLDYADRYR